MRSDEPAYYENDVPVFIDVETGEYGESQWCDLLTTPHVRITLKRFHANITFDGHAAIAVSRPRIVMELPNSKQPRGARGEDQWEVWLPSTRETIAVETLAAEAFGQMGAFGNGRGFAWTTEQ